MAWSAFYLGLACSLARLVAQLAARLGVPFALVLHAGSYSSCDLVGLLSWLDLQSGSAYG